MRLSRESLIYVIVPDLLLENAHIYSPTAGFRRGAMLVAGDRIEAILPHKSGTPAADRVVDLGGAWVLPGFVDTHIHLTSIALKSARCDLAGTVSADEVCERLSVWARATDGPHVMGVEWDDSAWRDPAYPTRHMLDTVDATRPVLARRICGHLGVANTVLLERLAGWSAPVAADLIDRESGLLREHALWEAGRVCQPDPDKLAASFENAIRQLHTLGITAIHDIVGTDKFDAYLKGIAASRAPLRIDMLLVTEAADFPRYRDMVVGVEGLRLVGMKCFLDGSLGGRTAALNEPYEKSSDTGVLFVDTDSLRATLRTCADSGFMCAMHAIGDRAIDQALDAVEGFPRDTDLFRMEHCEVVGPEQLARLQEAPLFLGLQPNFVRNWGEAGGFYEERLGAARLSRMNPFRAFEEAGVAFVFGSDGMPPGPLFGLRGATHHPFPEQRLTAAEAIDRYTRLPYQVGAHRGPGGVLQAGRPADLAVLDKNPLEADVDRVRVLRTMVGGRFVTG